MSEILDRAESITLNAIPNIRSSESINGYLRKERAGPVFYMVSATLPVLTFDEYISIQDEIQSINYSIDTLTTTLPHGLTYFEGDWNSSAAVSSVSGRDITLSGFNNNQSNTLRSTDFVQFSGDTKVYQFTNSPSADSSGNVVGKVNTDFIVEPTSSSTIIRGSSVEFKLSLATVPPVATITAAGNKNLYKFAGAFEFKEVL